jgi:hypothetical protein
MADLVRTGRRADEGGMDKTTFDLQLGGYHFRTERDSKRTGVRLYFINDLAVTGAVYLALMRHYRAIESQRLCGRSHPHPSARHPGQLLAL